MRVFLATILLVAVMAVLVLLPGCASVSGPQPKLVPTSCIPKSFPAAKTPPFSKEDMAKAPDPSTLMKELYADLLMMWPRLNADEAMIDNCR